ncbi:MAG: hypothetical protein WBZ27_02835, partial [Pseudolabrys sp.]
VSALPARSFLIDGEAIVTNGNGLAVFDPIRRKRNGGAAVLIAFDLIKLVLVKMARIKRTSHVAFDHCFSLNDRRD